MDSRALLHDVSDYGSFFSADELDAEASRLSGNYGFSIKEVGRSEQDRPMYLISAGMGAKNVFVWGFPHPNEPVGSLAILSLMDYFGRNPKALTESGYTWHFMPSADPDGARLNEGWFRGELTLENYFTHFYRPPASRMIDWTFPVHYKDFKWNRPLPETRVLMGVIDSIKPDLMYPLHNSGFGGAYFFSTQRFDDAYYASLINLAGKSGIPLERGEPEELFMRPIVKPFYFDFGLAEYYDQALALGRNPSETLKHGDNSTFYLLKSNPGAVVIKGEVPYFFSKEIANNALSSKTRREVWLSFLDQTQTHLEFVQPFVRRALDVLKEPNPWFYVVQDLQKRWDNRTDVMKQHVSSSDDFSRPATEAEVLNGVIGSYFYGGGLIFGQVRRAALASGLSARDITQLEEKIRECSFRVGKEIHWNALPIKNLVQMQLGVLSETLNALSRKN